jgi:hypothetical protein
MMKKPNEIGTSVARGKKVSDLRLKISDWKPI